MRRFLFGTATIAALGAAFWLFLSNRDAGPKNVVLVVVDALRADRTSAYGYSRPTPRIDRIAERGVLLEEAFAALPMTQPSFVTIYTSLHPYSHGILFNDNAALSSQAVTLAEILRDSGWQTAAVVGASNLDSVFGLNQGFAFYEDNLDILPPGQTKAIGKIARWERTAEEVNQAAISWLKQRPSHQPFFLMIHYFDPHDPYAPPPEYRKYGEKRSDLYDGEVAYTDQAIGELINALEQGNLLRNTLLVLTADHGEALGEHGLMGHKWKIYDEILRVPLILAGPGIPSGKRRDGLAHHVDLAPTILEYLGLPRPSFYQGHSLLPLIRTGQSVRDWVLLEKAVPPKRAYEEREAWRRYPYEQWAIRTKTEKFIWSSEENHEYYNLQNDPHEENNLYTPDQARALQLYEIGLNARMQMKQYRFASRPGRKKDDRDAEEVLRALGYLN